jgi:hypothetical protein
VKGSSPPGSRAPRPVSRGSPGTLAAHTFPAPPPPGFGQVELPDFASLLRCVSPTLVELSPGGSQVGTGPAVSSADPVSGVPPSHVSAQLAVPRDAVSTVPGWDQAGQAGPQVPPRRRLLEHHPAFARLLGASVPQADRVAPDDRVDPRLSSRSCPPSVPGGDVLSGRGTAAEDRDWPRDPQVSGDPGPPPSAYSLAASSAPTRGPLCGTCSAPSSGEEEPMEDDFIHQAPCSSTDLKI